MKIYFTEQDIVDAVCVHTAAIHKYRPEQIDVDLQFHPNKGFFSSARLPYRTIELGEQALIDAISFYLGEYHCFISEKLQVDLQFHEQTGFAADIMTV
ncbi:DUF2653 family protein (plasmid) [Bacillus mycoides]|nr:DUF2653 family protein [Bacillus mycoides]